MESHSRPYHLSDNPLKMLQMAQTAWKQCRGPVQLLQLAEVTPAVIGYSPETCQSKQPHCELHCPGVWVRKYQLPIQWLRREETIITGLICIGPGFFYAPRLVILTRKSLGMDLLLESASSSHWVQFLALLLLLHFSVFTWSDQTHLWSLHFDFNNMPVNLSSAAVMLSLYKIFKVL